MSAMETKVDMSGINISIRFCNLDICLVNGLKIGKIIRKKGEHLFKRNFV